MYKEQLCEAMKYLGEQPDTIVIGYNVKYKLFGGTLKDFPNDRIIEMPLAEALMAGVAIGMSLEKKWVPLLPIERFDFITLAMDQVVNHLDKISTLSDGLHKPAVIIRASVGNKEKPLFTGPTHTQCFSKALREMVDFPVIDLKWESSIVSEYEKAYRRAKKGISTCLVEYMDQIL